MNESPKSSQDPNYSQETAAWIEEQQKYLSMLEMNLIKRMANEGLSKEQILQKIKEIEYFLGDQ